MWVVSREKDSLSINKPFASFRSLSFVKNGQNLSQLLLTPLIKIGSKNWKIFWTQSFYIRHILYHFVSFMNKKFCSAWISQLPICHLNSKKDCKTLISKTFVDGQQGYYDREQVTKEKVLWIWPCILPSKIHYNFFYFFNNALLGVLS